jgi:tRNA (guanine37-N1)-methyltransferase
MRFHIVTIFPEIYESFLKTSLMNKAIEKGLLSFSFTNPRSFCPDKHQQVDDEIYGWGAGMLMKAEPVIKSVESIIVDNNLMARQNRKIVYMSPAEKVFNQETAYKYAKELQDIIIVNGRYEWIDYRFEQYMHDKYLQNFVKLSLGQFVTLWWELPSMVVIEAISRLISWVIKEEESHLIESYDPTQSMNNLEFPQYTRPEEIYGYKVPEVLLSGHHAEIEKRRKEQMKVVMK